jgi:hypothetical protein
MMTLVDYLTHLAKTYQSWELLLKSKEKSFTVSELLENLRPEERECSVGTETGGKGDFILDAQSGERLLQIIWSSARRGWMVRKIINSKPHYYVTKDHLLVSLCGYDAASCDSQLSADAPLNVPVCKKCCERMKQGASAVGSQCGPERLNITEMLLRGITTTFTSSSSERFKRGLVIYEPKVVGTKLAERNITVSVDGEPRRVPIDVLRSYYHAGKIPADSDVLVTATRADAEVYCGEGTVATVVGAWERAPLDSQERQEVKRMISEFKFPACHGDSKAQFSDLKRLYDRCSRYYRYVTSQIECVKRLTKEATSAFLLHLDEADATWDTIDGEAKFIEELRRQHPELIRTEAGKKERARRWDRQLREAEERQPIVEARNNLTRFPCKDMVLEVKDFGMLRVGDIKGKMRDGTISPTALVRYRDSDEWAELSEFLKNWLKCRATREQLDFLTRLHKQRGITDEIPVDMWRSAASARISELLRAKE